MKFFERKRDPFCSGCGCPMEERTYRYGEPFFDPKTGVGRVEERSWWECSNTKYPYHGYDHDSFSFGPRRTVPVKAKCS